MVSTEPGVGIAPPPSAVGYGNGRGQGTPPPRRLSLPFHAPRYRGLLRRFLAVHRHLAGLLLGAIVARGTTVREEHRRGMRAALLRVAGVLVRPFVAREMRGLSFARQLRRRLEMLGPTYVKFGQILAIREDLLPADICRELQSLFDHVPPVPFPVVR